MTWILATQIISLAHLMACVSQGRSYGKFTVFYLFINILCLFQELECKSHGLAALTINVNRLAKAHSHGSNLWELAHEHVTMLCLSPEQHMSKRFLDLLEHKPFWNRFCALRVDEIHLLYYLGLSFRVTLLQIEHVRSRCPANVITCALSASVAKGQVMDNVCKFKEGQFNLIRRLNDRPEVQLLIRKLQTALGGWLFL